MTTTHTTIICDNCEAKLKVKPGLLKVMKVIKCSKCKHSIKVADIIQVEVQPEPQLEPQPAIAAAPRPKAENAALLDQSVQVVESESAPVTPLPPVNYEEEMDDLKIQLAAAKQEVSELDERVASLQQLYQSKEVEVREMIARVHKAEAEAKQAIEVRDAFLARIKQELAVYLVNEREASLARFSELESKLMGLEPEG